MFIFMSGLLVTIYLPYKSGVSYKRLLERGKVMQSQTKDRNNSLSQAKPKLTHLNQGMCLGLLIQPI